MLRAKRTGNRGVSLGYPNTGGTMRKCGHFAAQEKEEPTVRTWGYRESKETRGADFLSIFRHFFFDFEFFKNEF